MRAIVSIFDNGTDAEHAIDKLEEIGYKPKDFSLIMQDKARAKEFADNTGTSVAGSAAGGAATGAVVGGLAGLLVGLGAITLPGIGAFLIGGPLAAALGLTGVAATTTSGAVTGAVAGGLVGALMGLGLSKQDAQSYEERIKTGGILLAVPVYQNQDEPVTDILKENKASDIKAVDNSRMTERNVTGIRSSEDQTITSFLHEDIDYPATREELLDHAQEFGNSDISDALSGLPDKSFNSAEEVMDALPGEYHTRPTAQPGSTGSHRHHHAVNPVQVEKYLKAVDYPCSKVDLVETAEEEGADKDVIETLQDLPEEKFNSPKDVSKAIGSLR